MLSSRAAGAGRARASMLVILPGSANTASEADQKEGFCCHTSFQCPLSMNPWRIVCTEDKRLGFSGPFEGVLRCV